MGAFNLADVLRETSAQDLGQENREQIQYIDIDLIDPDPRNFYELSDLDELAANIELVGLQQPLRVRVNPDDAGRWMIVSGHRRRAAIRQLVDEGKDQLRAVACIVEQPAGSEALQELRLIYANSGTRKLTPAEISKQAERVEMLLYELKEQGMEFPGRMRDHVAEACKVSKSKLARLKVIRENLIPELDELNKQDKLPESVAYVLAKMEPEDQKDVYRKIFTKACYSVTESRVVEYGKFSKDLRRRRCTINKGSCCTNRDAMANKWVNENSWAYHRCEHVKCCSECSDLGSCKSACPMLGDKIKKIKADKREARRQEKAAQEAKEYPDKVMIRELWYRFGYARQRARMSVKQACEASGQYYYPDLKKRYEEHESDDVEVTIHEMLPYKFITLDEIKSFVALADALGVSLDYLFRRTDDPAGKPVQIWRNPEKGELPEDGQSVIAVVQYDVPRGIWVTEDLRFRDGKFQAFGSDMPDDIRLFWQPRFEPPEDVPDSGTDEESEDNDD